MIEIHETKCPRKGCEGTMRPGQAMGQTFRRRPYIVGVAHVVSPAGPGVLIRRLTGLAGGMADISITDTAVKPTATKQAIRGIAGAAIAIGKAVYKDAADSNKIKLADANAEASAAAVGITVTEAVAAGQPIYYVADDDALDLGLTSASAGEVLCVSETGGGIAPHADLIAANEVWVTILGVVKSDGKVRQRIVIGGETPAA